MLLDRSLQQKSFNYLLNVKICKSLNTMWILSSIFIRFCGYKIFSRAKWLEVWIFVFEFGYNVCSIRLRVILSTSWWVVAVLILSIIAAIFLLEQFVIEISTIFSKMSHLISIEAFILGYHFSIIAAVFWYIYKVGCYFNGPFT